MSKLWRLMGGLGVVLGAALYADRVRCAWGGHDPRRHPIGGFICSRCGLSGARLSDLGFSALDDYVSTTRDGGIDRKER